MLKEPDKAGLKYIPKVCDIFPYPIPKSPEYLKAAGF